MDLNDYWQENKKFLLTVFAGLVVFLIGQVLISSFLDGKLQGAQRQVSNAKKKLGASMYGSADLTMAREENAALQAAVASLSEAVAFEPRPEFKIDASGGRASNQFFATVTSAREDLLRLAQRRGVRLPDHLGMPGLSPTHEDEIVRTLEALDVVDRACRLAIDAGVSRIDELGIKLDPGLGSRDGVGQLEKTSVSMTLSGPGAALLRFLSATQSTEEYGQALVVEELLLQPSRRKNEEARLDLELNVIRLHIATDDEEVEG